MRMRSASHNPAYVARVVPRPSQLQTCVHVSVRERCECTKKTEPGNEATYACVGVELHNLRRWRLQLQATVVLLVLVWDQRQ